MILPYSKLPLIGSLIFVFISFFKIIYLNKKYRFNLIHAQDATCSGLAAILSGRLIGVPVIVHSHGIIHKFLSINFQSFRKEHPIIFSLYFAFCLLLERLIVQESDFVITVNEESKRYFISRGVPASKCSVIRVGIDVKKFHQNEYLPKGDAIIVSFIGNLGSQKNPQILVESWSIIDHEFKRKAKLVMLGDGPLKPYLEKRAEILGLKNITFLGARPESDKLRLLRDADIVVIPSLVEACPTVLLEAMAAGKAIIASNIPAIRELVEDGKEALLFNPHDHEQLKDTILKLNNNPELRRKLGENSKKKAKQYDVSAVFSKIIQTYQEILKKHHMNKRGI